MSLKDNFYQALRELLKGGSSDSDSSKKMTSNTDLNSVVKTTHDSTERDMDDFADFNDKEISDDRTGLETIAKTNHINIKDKPGQSYRPNIFFRSGNSNTIEETMPKNSDDLDQTDEFSELNPAKEVTVISKSTVVVGDIHSLANVTIDGSVRGNVSVLKDATISGALIGDLKCSNSDMVGSTVEGNVLAKGKTYIDNDSTLYGDMSAQYSSIDGKVKGNMNIGSKIQLHQNAIVAGNINTSVISIEEGANIKGFVNTGFLAENDDTVFPNQIIKDEEFQIPNE